MSFTFGFMLVCSIAFASCSLDVTSILKSIDHPLPGPSPNFDQEQNFNRTAAGGKWYGHYMLNVGMPDLPIHCWSFVGTNGDGENIEAAVTLFVNTVNVEVDTHITVVPVAGEQSKYIMKQLTAGPLTTSMVVLTTDYENYFVKIDLFDVAGLGHAYSVNVYSRYPEDMDPATLNMIKALIQKQGITKDLTYVPQNCSPSLQSIIKGWMPF